MNFMLKSQKLVFLCPTFNFYDFNADFEPCERRDYCKTLCGLANSLLVLEAVLKNFKQNYQGATLKSCYIFRRMGTLIVISVGIRKTVRV